MRPLPPVSRYLPSTVFCTTIFPSRKVQKAVSHWAVSRCTRSKAKQHSTQDLTQFLGTRLSSNNITWSPYVPMMPRLMHLLGFQQSLQAQPGVEASSSKSLCADRSALDHFLHPWLRQGAGGSGRAQIVGWIDKEPH